MNLVFEDLDDLQLAVERLLVEAASQDTVQMRIDVVDHGVRVGVGPLRERTIADALQGPDAAPGELTLRRILQTVVDSFGVEEHADGGISRAAAEGGTRALSPSGTRARRLDRDLLRRYHEDGDVARARSSCSATCRWSARWRAATPAAASRSRTSSRSARSA